MKRKIITDRQQRMAYKKKSEKMSMNSSINRKNVYYVDLGEDHISSNIVVWCYRIVNNLMY